MIDNELLEEILLDVGGEKNIFDLVKNGISITNKNYQILYLNPAFTNITGYSQHEALGKNLSILHSDYHEKEFYKEMWDTIANQGYWEGEIWNRRKSGQLYPEYLTISKIFPLNKHEFFYVAIFSDITFIKKDANKKIHLAFYDPLTELPNRNFFFDHLEKIPAHIANHSNRSIALLYMDLDGFKEVNDTLGHSVGDKLLHLVGKRLASVTRHGDTMARIGGDEFAAIIYSENDKQGIEKLSKRIVDAIEQPFMIGEHTINISISVGISFYPVDTDNLETLINYADKAMYAAKNKKEKIVFHQSIT